MSWNSSMTDLEDAQLPSPMESKAGVVDRSEHGNEHHNKFKVVDVDSSEHDNQREKNIDVIDKAKEQITTIKAGKNSPNKGRGVCDRGVSLPADWSVGAVTIETDP